MKIFCPNCYGDGCATVLVHIAGQIAPHAACVAQLCRGRMVVGHRFVAQVPAGGGGTAITIGACRGCEGTGVVGAIVRADGW